MPEAPGSLTGPETEGGTQPTALCAVKENVQPSPTSRIAEVCRKYDIEGQQHSVGDATRKALRCQVFCCTWSAIVVYLLSIRIRIRAKEQIKIAIGGPLHRSFTHAAGIFARATSRSSLTCSTI